MDLVAPSASEYSSLLIDIERRLSAFEALPFGEDDPTAAILLNRSDKAIAAWSLIRSCEEWNGRRYTSSIVSGCGMIPSLLLPFGMTKEARAISGYWHVILPGSQRYVSGGRMLGTMPTSARQSRRNIGRVEFFRLESVGATDRWMQ